LPSVDTFDERMAFATYSTSPPDYCDDPGTEAAASAAAAAAGHQSVLLFLNDKKDNVSGCSDYYYMISIVDVVSVVTVHQLYGLFKRQLKRFLFEIH